MKSVICNDKEKCTGNAYYMEDYPLIGKTGTAQLYDEKTGTYHITTIDINRSSFVKNPSREKCMYNLMRVTHVRPTMERIVQRYSELRNWDAVDSIRYVTQKLEAFEKKKEMHRRIKKIIKFK